MYIARPPILDRESRIAGYELLFRAGGGPIADGRHATATVVQKVFLDAGFGEALGPHPGFVNVDADFLRSEEIELLAPERAVLELLETVEFTPEVVARCEALRAKGYRLAADDWAGDRTAIAPVLGLLDIVKVDLPRLAHREPAALARELPGKTLLAEKVETESEYRRFRDAGFALFQGYYFARPQTLGAARPDPVRLGALRVLARLADEDADEKALEEEIKREPGVALGLLRLANPASGGLARPIGSLREALLYVGRRQLRLWLQLLVYLGAAGGEPARAPLLQLAAVRGKAMEILARRSGRAGELESMCARISPRLC